MTSAPPSLTWTPAHASAGSTSSWRVIQAPTRRPTTLREGLARRQRLAAGKFVSPADVRAQLLFLDGTPAERAILDCGTTFKPIEVWTYKTGAEPGARSGSIVIYRPEPDEPFRAWTPNDGKRVLYSSEMENWLEQWEELRGMTRASASTCSCASRRC